MFVKVNLIDTLAHIDVIATYHFNIDHKNEKYKICHKIEQIIKKHNLSHVKREYVRSIGNGLRYGKCPIKCSVYVGKNKRSVIVIHDSGKGFDHQDIVKKFHKGAKYYQRGGCGFKSLSHDNVKVDWDDNGRKIILYYQ